MHDKKYIIEDEDLFKKKSEELIPKMNEARDKKKKAVLLEEGKDLY